MEYKKLFAANFKTQPKVIYRYINNSLSKITYAQ